MIANAETFQAVAEELWHRGWFAPDRKPAQLRGPCAWFFDVAKEPTRSPGIPVGTSGRTRSAASITGSSFHRAPATDEPSAEYFKANGFIQLNGDKSWCVPLLDQNREPL